MLNRRRRMPAIPVGVVTAERKPVTKSQDFVGRVEAVQRVEVRARITGYLEKVAFTEGDLIKEGAPLYSIEKGLFEAAVGQAEGCTGEGQGCEDTDRNSVAARRGTAVEGIRHPGCPRPGLRRRRIGQRFASHRSSQSADREDQPRLYGNHFADCGQGRQDQYHQG